MIKILLLLILVVYTAFGFESFNYVNKKYKITQSSELEKIYTTEISPYYDRVKLHYFLGEEALKIAYKIFLVPNAKANIVISSGRTEGMFKYKELIYDLNRNGYSVYIYDHRGQGYSGRMAKDSQLGHIDNFMNYVEDMKTFFNDYVNKDRKIFLLAHSMGGAIASLYIEKYIYDFDGVVLTSPMHQPDLISARLTKMVCTLIKKRESNRDKYIFGEVSYDDSEAIFNKNKLTHSKIRFDLTLREYEQNPELKIGGPSVKWVSEACEWSHNSVEMAENIQIPVLLMQAAKDTIVNLKPQEEFCRTTLGFCKGIKIDGAYHELLVEEDEIRNRAMSAMFDFFKLHTKD